MTYVARRPLLHTVPESPDETPSFRGIRCTACDAVFFPPHRYGCESCGAGPDRIEPELLSGSGALRSFATVYRHLLPQPKTPFVIGIVELDAGPELEAILVSEDEKTWAAGSRVRATLVPGGQNDEGQEIVDCRFTAAPAGEGDA
jgi:uncharacterized OB-fold protein